MSVALEIVAPGAMASLQDLGRSGYRRLGVPRAGALDPALLRIANALAGNPEAAPAIEFFGGGLTLKAVGGPVRLGCAGDFAVDVSAGGQSRRLPGWRSLTLGDGERLRCAAISGGSVGIVAVAGLVLPLTLGSASTYARAGLGGIDGRLLGAGTQLPLPPLADAADRTLTAPLPRPTGPIRIVRGPQDDHFTAAALAQLLDSDYRVSPEADRMGIRLDGPHLAHRPDRGAEIVSDATVPGSIQVPGNGRPIVLLADGQTAGGYPKIATVISADLPRLACLPPGAVLRFAEVDVDAAEAAARQREAQIRAALAGIVALAADGNVDALYAGNLVSGVVDALASEFRPRTGDRR